MASLENQVKAALVRLPMNYWQKPASFSSSAKFARPIAMLNAVTWSVGSVSPEYDGRRNFSVDRSHTSILIRRENGVLSVAARARSSAGTSL